MANIGWKGFKEAQDKRIIPNMEAKERAELAKRLRGAGIGLEWPQMRGVTEALDSSDYFYNKKRPPGGKVPEGFQSHGRAQRGLTTMRHLMNWSY